VPQKGYFSKSGAGVAVKIACELDPNSGLPVEVIKYPRDQEDIPDAYVRHGWQFQPVNATH
jgi:hypothetical protein